MTKLQTMLLLRLKLGGGIVGTGQGTGSRDLEPSSNLPGPYSYCLFAAHHRLED
ncbi:MAG: hypothetical protein GY940_10715 [bacterium]|nr:hypothetical protein [bacterium]